LPTYKSQISQKLGNNPLTTIANWCPYKEVTHAGEYYGHKDKEFLLLKNLPKKTSQNLEIALTGASKEITQQFREAGWSIRDAVEISTEVPIYQRYIWNSSGEFSVAKQAYIKTKSGWFSDRSVCYLAAGRPLVIQDTGLNDWLKGDKGILLFTSFEQAVDCLELLKREFTRHSMEAKKIADQIFSYKRVLNYVIETALSLKAPSHSVKPTNYNLGRVLPWS